MAPIYPLELSVEYGEMDLTVSPVAIPMAEGIALVDVGPPRALPDLEAALADVGYAVEDVRVVVLTHHDGDHVGALPALLEGVTPAPLVCAHPAEVAFIEGDRPPLKSEGAGPGVPVGLATREGTAVRTLAGPVRIVETPGHSPGHCSLYVPDSRTLIAGDALVADGDAPIDGPKAEYTPEMAQALESVEKLAGLAVDRTICFHGGETPAGTAAIRSILSS